MAMIPGKHYVNSPVYIPVNFRDADSDDVDPTTVAIRVMSPSGTDTTYTYGTDAEVGKSSVGDYYADITPTESGRWHYRWQTTGTGVAIAIEGTFLVQASAFYDGVWRAYDR